LKSGSKAQRRKESIQSFFTKKIKSSGIENANTATIAEACEELSMHTPNGKFTSKGLSGGISSVIAPVGEDGAWVEVTGKERIERALLDENQRRFNQASEIPFMRSPLYDAVGPLGISNGSQEILSTAKGHDTNRLVTQQLYRVRARACISPPHTSARD
jgi:hypothetical protein